jgi:hypothetical protein
LDILNKAVELCTAHLQRVENWRKDFEEALGKVNENAGKFVGNDRKEVSSASWIQETFGGWKKVEEEMYTKPLTGVHKRMKNLYDGDGDGMAGELMAQDHGGNEMESFSGESIQRVLLREYPMEVEQD